MFGLIKKVFIGLLISRANASNHTNPGNICKTPLEDVLKKRLEDI